MPDIVERLYDLNERFIFQGGSEFARKLADETMALRTKVHQWESVFGHLGTADEVGNEWIALKDEIERLRAELDALKAQEPVASVGWGCGGSLEWVAGERLSPLLGRRCEAPVRVRLYAAPQPAIPDGFVLVPKEPTDEMIEAAVGAGWSRVDIYQAMLAVAPKPGDAK